MNQMQTIIGQQFPKKVIPLIEQAKRSIKIIIFAWRWYPNDPGNPVQLFNQAIVRAARRGVRVEAITNFDGIDGLLVEQGVVVIKTVSKNLIHAKLMIIDDENLIMGSHNYTQSAFTTNHEISMISQEVSAITEYAQFFETLRKI